MWYDKNALYLVVSFIGRLPVQYDEDGNGRYDLSQKELMTLMERHVLAIEK